MSYIYFDGQQIGIQIPPLPFRPEYTIEHMYQYLQQNLIDISQCSLSCDGQSPLNPKDNTSIAYYIQQNQCSFTIIQIQPLVSIFFGEQQILQQALPDMIITEILNHLQSQGFAFPQNVALDFYDENQLLIAQDVDINSNLYNYTQGNQVVLINIRQVQSYNQQKQVIKVPSNITNLPAQDLLQQLILLKNLSLLIDPNNQFVVYKFHFPTLVQGYLQKSKGKDPEHCTQFNWQGQDWVEKNSIKYCSFDDYGFAILWEDGNLSYVKIEQQ
ncbi:unnamed protein product (macronuclear) [Paramecium tetraurelia]|uniref:Ubiquitin-like domain-containing protein n=1 Tax=Paramecium tetraurelia TaxID=5888 RepID=A0DMC8_PARTE|nr:uncharacterized protein GSPATT00018413001 [Paramecium tetraurelia]CAK84195.1 unnamed protein product [Paramecium tetraurelia]|eukprot:XP_001451592.1 hypothetical protein (macronuclear) [Paramecium tetraurelia strain d4-2]